MGNEEVPVQHGVWRMLAATRGTEKISEVLWGGGEMLMALA